MGHYASEMSGPEEQIPPSAVEEMNFYQPYAPPFYDAGVNLWVHRGCDGVFLIRDKHEPSDAIVRHFRTCIPV